MDKVEVEVGATAKSAQAVVEDGIAAARALLAGTIEPEDRLAFARAIVLQVVRRYWKAAAAAQGRRWALRKLPCGIELDAGSAVAATLAKSIGDAAAELDAVEAAYRIGTLYTGVMPRGYRAALGAYYTPPPLCERLLDMAEEAGVDWESVRVLDPACGGGAFLAPVARRMAASLEGRRPDAVLIGIGRRLRGFELDPFAAWMAQVFLDVTLSDLCREAGHRVRSVVEVCDTLEQAPVGEGFDLVVGNPPYGRVKLPSRLRGKFAGSLYGHANLYGLFTDLALRFAKANGVVAYVTPTSFLAGEYFKALRGLLGREAPPSSIAFVGERKGVFADVLQETLLAVYKRSCEPEAGKVYLISAGPDGLIESKSAGSFNLPKAPDQPWLLPRTERQGTLLGRAGRLTSRLADLGYTVSTGPLVWNRHKSGLRVRRGDGCYPLVWAESVRTEGEFEFRAAKRNHKPYFKPKPKERWVVTDYPCVLLQRTTAKEQRRRLIAAELPAAFVDKHGGVVVENHLNMIRSVNGAAKTTTAVLTAVLNSNVVDQVFRCINGSVAVSAYELEALPLPATEDMQTIGRLVESDAGRERVERAVALAYGCEEV